MNTSLPRPIARAFAGLPAAAIAAFVVSLFASVATAWAQTAPARPPGQAPAGDAKDVTVLSAFEVTDQSGLGYRATRTLAGAGIATEIRDLPSSISVLNREFMDDLMVTNIEELSKFFMSGEFEPAPEASISSGGAVRMRGIPTGNLRDGIYHPAILDSHAIDRVEILRGPNGFLYTGAGAGGNPNQVTKQAVLKDTQTVRFVFGSYNLRRAELDVNRVVTNTERHKLAVRTSLAFQAADGWANHSARKFQGGMLTVNYRPFGGKTNINAVWDYGKDMVIMTPKILSDQYSTSERTGATTAYTVTTGGRTLFPALGTVYDTVGQRRTSGTNLALSDRSFIKPETNFRGPDAYNDTWNTSHGLTVDHRFTEALSLQLTARQMEVRKVTRTTIGSSQASIYKDTNPTLPNGANNPYFGEYYNEYVNREYYFKEPTTYYRAAAVYELKLPFTTQRIIGSMHYHIYDPNFLSFSEFVDPRSANFRGAFIDATTLAAYRANLTTQNNNRFYRRFYLRDGDAAHITNAAVVPGQSRYLRDITADGNDGRLYWRDYWNKGGSIGATGTYFKERLHSFVGWRSDSFERQTGGLFYNVAQDNPSASRQPAQFSSLDFTLPSHPRQNPGTNVRGDSVNYGLVFHAFKFLSFYANYAESVSLNVAAGGTGLIPGSTIPSPKGFGEDYGVRWLFLDGAIESNWTYYTNNRTAGAAIPANVSRDELALLFTGINPDATDSQTVSPKGIEFDTIINLTRNLRLIWNYSSNKLSNTDRYPVLNSVRADARTKGFATPLTDAFLATVPEGTPSAGFTKIRSNLVASYRFSSGPLKNFSVGGGAQYRDVTYKGNFDLNRDGVAEEIWGPGYTVVNLMFGYRTRVRDRPVDLGLNISNVLDKEYFRATALSTGAWGEERNFRLSVRVDL
ncbi:MAG: TonB-dependent receptor plug domain-containing protein [Verrucomicrobia bacterium]|nr:TonB-dependent receptor plug domain-containing protein [Verrucomicrobiota bacterium]